MNFRQLDLNLLRVLAAIHRTGSVTQAGKALSLSQPATSNALARLRDFLKMSFLCVRLPGLKPTRLCEQLAPAVLAQLLALETLVTGHEEFEAAHSDMHWRLSLSDLGEMLFLPELAGALRSQAPGARLSNISVAATEVAAALEAREIDLAIGILQPRHRGIRTELLFREHYVAVAAPQWRPASGRSGRTLTPQQLAEAAFVVASPTATFHGSVEQMLVRMKLEDRIVLRARHFGALPDLALTTDLLSIVPEMYAQSAPAL
ncbi:LysR family transcriptional regulator [Polaromonas sp. P1(28)-13]|nr:LysR family transcriptional regulator [Polaromonas sp. P1(28)-13]